MQAKISFLLLFVAADIFSGCVGESAAVTREPIHDDNSANLPMVSSVSERTVSPELKNGTATLAQVKAWATVELTLDYEANTPSLEMEEMDWNLDGMDDLMISDVNSTLNGTGGRNYLMFEKTPAGYRFMGHWFFGIIRPLPKDQAGRQYILLGSHLGYDEEEATLNLREGDGYREVSHVIIHGHDGDESEGSRLLDALFNAKTVSPETLRQVFGQEF